ncbi:MAG: 2-hydroxy-3-oxopropionate reductase [Sphaerochaetaceae bacterium]|nr:2-hydroxy-3-oxopropionate reductase [Sphaerochaetaceae bacterium]
MKVGFVGLGIMGRPMCKNILKAGYEVTAFDPFAKEALDDVVSCGAKRGTSNADVAAQSDVVIIMVPNSPHVRAAVFDKGGIAEGAKPGLDVIDMSSIAPLQSKAIAEDCVKIGINMMDAPVSGGEPKAIDGSLSIMCGGPKSLFDKYKNLLGVMGASVVHCGEVNGAGDTVKLANQVVVACNIAACAEAYELATMAGVNPEKVFDAIKGGLAGSTVMNAKVPMMMDRNFKPGFRIDLHIKDLNNALETGHGLGTPMILTSAVQEMLQWLHNNGSGSDDHSAIVKYYERISGTEVKK